MLYTSYFAKQKNNKTDNLYAITCYRPLWFNGVWLKEVAPPVQLVNDYKDRKISRDEYTKIYLNILESNKGEIINRIKSLPDNSILLFFVIDIFYLNGWENKESISEKNKTVEIQSFYFAIIDCKFHL